MREKALNEQTNRHYNVFFYLERDESMTIGIILGSQGIEADNRKR